jgi:hypothetical protein
MICIAATKMTLPRDILKAQQIKIEFQKLFKTPINKKEANELKTEKSNSKMVDISPNIAKTTITLQIKKEISKKYKN